MFEREPGERVMLLTAGRVKAARVGADGHESLLGIRDPGDVIGELAFIDSQPRSATVTALDPVEAIVIPAQVFRAHLEHTPRVAVVLLEVVTRKLREADLKRSQLAASDTVGRVAARILELSDRYGEPGDRGILIVSPLSLEEFAAWAGASRAGVAAALRTLRELEWIQTTGRRILLLNRDALQARAA
jgi:CRP-like cAMP-binding protein